MLESYELLHTHVGALLTREVRLREEPRSSEAVYTNLWRW